MSQVLSFKDGESVPTLKDIFPALKRQWKIVLAIFLAVSLLAGYILSKGVAYTTSGQILLKPPVSTSPSSAIPEPLEHSLSIEPFSLATQVGMISSDSLKKKLAKKLGGDLAPGSSSVVTVGKHAVTLTVQPPQDGEIATVNAVSSDPNLAADGVNGLMKLYIEELYDAQYRDLKNAESKVRDLASKTRLELNVARSDVARIEKNYGAPDPSKSIETDITSLGNIKNQVDVAKAAMDAGASEIASLQQQVTAEPRVQRTLPNPDADQGIQAIELSLSNLKAQREADSKIYTDLNPHMQSLDAQIALAERQLATAKLNVGKRSSVYNPERSSLLSRLKDSRTQYASRKATYEDLKAAFERAQGKVSTYPNFSALIARSVSTVERKQADLDRYETMASNIEMREKTILAGASIVSAAPVPGKPEGGKSALIGMVSLLGLMIGCVVAILYDRGDDRLRADSLLGSVTRLGVIAVPSRQNSNITELGILTARNVLARLRIAFSEGQPQRIVIASVSSPEDQAIAVASLSLAAASIGLSVSVVVSSASPNPTREDVGYQIDKLVSASGMSESWRVTVLGAGTEMAINEVTRGNVSPEVQAQLTVVAAPPVQDLAGFAATARHDGVILVGRSNADTKRALFAALDELDNVGAYIKGFVLLEPVTSAASAGKDIHLVAALDQHTPTTDVVRSEI